LRCTWAAAGRASARASARVEAQRIMVWIQGL
jgi:hypothetical protein